jgi:hypothetical protein
MQDKKDVSMGCNSDHMNPTAREVNSSKTAGNLAYALEKMGMSIPDSVSSAAQSYYGNASRLNEFTVALCDLCRSMSDEQKDSIIFNGREPKARLLADWWSAHLAADEARINKEMRDELMNEIEKKVDLYRQQLINELSESQRALLKSL